MADDPTVLSKLVRLAKQAGAPSEGTYDRNGGFSWHAETHAAGFAFGVGLAAVTTNELRYVSALLSLVFGANRGPDVSSARIADDIKQEPHYAAGGLAVGLLLGALISR